MFEDDLKEFLEKGQIVEARALVVGQLGIDRFIFPMKVLGRWEELPPDFFEPDDSEMKFLSSELWSKGYWDELCVELEMNFSKEKLAHILGVMQYLRDKNDPEFIVYRKMDVNGENGTESDNKKKVILTVGGLGLGIFVAKALYETWMSCLVGASVGGVLGFTLAKLAARGAFEKNE